MSGRSLVVLRLLIGLCFVRNLNSQVADCMTYDTCALGRCTPIRDCAPVMRKVLAAPSPMTADLVNHLQLLHCDGFSDNLPIVCCSLDGDDQQSAATTVPSTTTEAASVVITTPTLRVSDRAADPPPAPSDDELLIADHRNLRLLPLDDCGPLMTEKISSGNLTELFEFPWMVQLAYANELTGNHTFRCGGSLINARYVLTAAHCVTNLQRSMRLVSVRLGEHTIATNPDCHDVDGTQECAEPVQDIKVAEVLWHEHFSIDTKANDIALVRLANDADMKPESVRPVCLPVTAGTTVPKRLTITGWGLTEKQKISDQLLQAHLPSVTNEECQQMFGIYAKIQPTHLCAGGERGVDSCKGDSGGALVSPAVVRTAQMVQFGIVSAGVDRCSLDSERPGLYTRVSSYMRWILDRMRE